MSPFGPLWITIAVAMAKSKKPLWRCPKCGREFVFRTREHSCDVTSVEQHLAKTTPEMRELYGELERWLEQLGDCKITPVKTSIMFSVRRLFGSVTVQRQALLLNVILDRVLKGERIRRVTRMGQKRLSHQIKLESSADFEQQVKQWLRDAYAMACNA